MESTETATRCKKPKSFLQNRFKFNMKPNLGWREKINSYNVSFALKALVVWSLFEILLCYIVICTKPRDANYVDNFLFVICSDNQCPGFLEKALYGRIILSIISIVGILMVRQFVRFSIFFFVKFTIQLAFFISLHSSTRMQENSHI